MPHPVRKHMSLTAAARLVGQSQTVFWRRAQSGEFKTEKKTPRLVIVSIAELESRFGKFSAEQIDKASIGPKGECSGVAGFAR